MKSFKKAVSVVAILPEYMKPYLKGMPSWLSPCWYTTPEQALEYSGESQIAWLDLPEKNKNFISNFIDCAPNFKWLVTFYSGVDHIPLNLLKSRNAILTNGTGFIAKAVAEYTILGMLVIAKGYKQVVEAQNRYEWLLDSPGKIELAGTKALIIGYGAIGQQLKIRLEAFEVESTVARRFPDENSPYQIGMDKWKKKLKDFDWIILALPYTKETNNIISENEFNKMKKGTSLINISRGELVDEEALVRAIKSKKIQSAFLDVTKLEPLPSESELWKFKNVHISMHLAGRSQTHLLASAGKLFLKNLKNFKEGVLLENNVNLDLGY